MAAAVGPSSSKASSFKKSFSLKSFDRGKEKPQIQPPKTGESTSLHSFRICMKLVLGHVTNATVVAAVVRVAPQPCVLASVELYRSYAER